MGNSEQDKKTRTTKCEDHPASEPLVKDDRPKTEA
jgi:hypothetical protein